MKFNRTKTIFLFFVFPFLLAGCSRTYLLTETPRLRFYEKVNRSAEDQDGRITLVNGRSFPGRSIRVFSDSVRWKDVETGEDKARANHRINTIVFVNHKEAAIKGIKVGSVVGGMAGTILPPLLFSGTERKEPALYIFPSVAFGALTGFTIWGIAGIKERFVFVPAASSKTKDE